MRLGELFCGCGGIALGAKNAGITPVWGIDMNADACQTYRWNICPENPESVLCADVRDIDFAELPPVDGLAFGFPCNDFSTLGKRQGFEGQYGNLYKYCVEAIKIHKPKWFFAENVAHIMAIGKRKPFRQIKSEFAVLGYDLYPNTYNFEDYGIPQYRARMIMIGIRNDLGIDFEPPTPTFQHLSCRDALQNIPENALNHEKPNHNAKVIERLSHIRPGESAFQATPHLPPELRMPKFGNGYFRLDPNKPSSTITGASTFPCHWQELRALTNREAARLQTFPDDFRFWGSKQSVRKQIGMAVPPKGAEIIFGAILRSFREKGAEKEASP